MAQLKEFVDIYLGVTHTPEYVEKGIPFLSVKDISGGKICFDACKYISEDEYSGLSQGAKPQVGDMLFCRVGTIGKPIIIPEGTPTFGSFVSLGYLRNKDANKCSLEYLRYWMYSKSFERQVYANVKGASQVNLNTGWLSKFEVVLPDIVIQKDVVKKLDRCIAVIDKRKQELEELDNLIKSRFVEMFDEGKYHKVPLGDLVLRKVSTAKKDFEQTDLIKYIDISSIDNKRNVMTGYTEYIMSEAPSRAQQHIKKGDIVVSTVRPNLKNVAITEFDDDNLVASSGFCVLRTIKCLPAYLMAIVSSDNFTDAMTKVVTGANYPAIKDSDVLGYEVPLPPIALQEQFAAFVKQVDKLKFVVQKSLEEAQLLFDSMMQKYFG